MARVKLSEYRAKSLLQPGYTGVSLRLDSLDSDVTKLDDSIKYVVKVDQGIKKRGKQGLIRLNVSKSDCRTAVQELSKKGFNRFIAEPMLVHDDDEERYVSFERTRSGILISYSEKGGVDIEDNPKSVKQYTTDNSPLPADFVKHVINKMNEEHFSFVEINPLIIRNNTWFLLDAAVLADSAGEYTCSWSEQDIVEATTQTPSEEAVADMNRNSPAAFSLRVLNPDGSIWLLLSGGGASITIADEAMNQGKANLIGNYGEYSGGPSSEETYLYTSRVIAQMALSKADKKCLVIAGGVANFTDVKKTFTGIIQALTENLETLQSDNTKVYVRRGGPNETEGLAMMRKFLEMNELLGSVHGSEILLTSVVNEALEYIDA